MNVSIIALLCGGFAAGVAVGGSLAMRWASWSREDEEETEHLRAVEMRNVPYRNDWPIPTMGSEDQAARQLSAGDRYRLVRDPPGVERVFGRRAEIPPQPDYGWCGKPRGSRLES